MKRIKYIFIRFCSKPRGIKKDLDVKYDHAMSSNTKLLISQTNGIMGL